LAPPASRFLIAAFPAGAAAGCSHPFVTTRALSPSGRFVRIRTLFLAILAAGGRW